MSDLDVLKSIENELSIVLKQKDDFGRYDGYGRYNRFYYSVNNDGGNKLFFVFGSDIHIIHFLSLDHGHSLA